MILPAVFALITVTVILLVTSLKSLSLGEFQKSTRLSTYAIGCIMVALILAVAAV